MTPAVGLNIAHVVESMEVGGAEVVVATLCRLERDRGHDVAVHCLDRPGPLAQQLQREGIPVSVHGPLPNARQALSLFRAFRRTGRQVIHCHNVAATIFGAPAGRLAGAGAVISTRHGSISPPPRRRRLFWLAARFCDAVVAVGEAPQRVLASELGAIREKVIVIRNAASPAPVASSETATASKKGFTAIMVARLAPPKDHATLLRALAIACRHVPDLYLWIVGDGVLRPQLHTLAAQLDILDRVDFVGERQDVGNWLARADVFVLSSQSEGVPVSLLEALASGLPLIVTDVGGMPEIVRLSGAGLVVDPGREDALAEALIRFAGNRNQLQGLGEAARRCYRQHFTPGRWVDTYLDLYQRCLNHSGLNGLRPTDRSPSATTADYHRGSV